MTDNMHDTVVDYDPFSKENSFLAKFNSLMSTTTDSYFTGSANVLEPLNDEEFAKIDKFFNELEEVKSISIFYALLNMIWKNQEFVFVPNINYDEKAVKILIRENFFTVPTADGMYIFLSNKIGKNTDKFTLVDLFDRAYTTRVNLPKIFHDVLNQIMLTIVLRKDKVEEITCNLESNFMNVNTVYNVLSATLYLPIQKDGNKLKIFLLGPLVVREPEVFKVSREYFSILRRYLNIILEEATNRKTSCNLYCMEPFIKPYLVKTLSDQGFNFVESGGTIKVSWKDPKDKESLAYKCLIRYNTMVFYRRCAAYITRGMKVNPDFESFLLPPNKQPIDRDFFENYFNARQCKRCFPLQRDDSRKLPFLAKIRPTYIERLMIEKEYPKVKKTANVNR